MHAKQPDVVLQRSRDILAEVDVESRRNIEKRLPLMFVLFVILLLGGFYVLRYV